MNYLLLKPKIIHQIRATSGRKKLKSTRLWIKNTLLAVIRLKIRGLFGEFLIFLRADLNTITINYRMWA